MSLLRAQLKTGGCQHRNRNSSVRLAKGIALPGGKGLPFVQDKPRNRYPNATSAPPAVRTAAGVGKCGVSTCEKAPTTYCPELNGKRAAYSSGGKLTAVGWVIFTARALLIS